MIDAPDTLDERDSPPLADVQLGPEPAPTPDPVDVPLGPAADGLTDTVRAMRDELAAHYKGANPPSIDLAIKAVQPGSAIPRSWDSRGMAGKAVKAYRDSIGGTPKAPAKTEPARTAAPKVRRTNAVRPKPASPAPVAVQPSVPPAPEPVVREPVPQPVEVVQPEPVPQAEPVVRTAPIKPLVVWPVWVLMLPAFVAVWAGWVELGKLTGFGPVDLLPGFTRDGKPLVTLDTAITLPIGMETYAAYALYVWLSGRTSGKTRKFAMASALIALSLGAGAQITYHLIAAPTTGAPWQITTVVACLPVVVLGIGAALGHLVREDSKHG